MTPHEQLVGDAIARSSCPKCMAFPAEECKGVQSGAHRVRVDRYKKSALAPK